MKYHYIVLNIEKYQDASELEKVLNFNGKDGFHIVAAFGKLVIMEQEEEEE